jgi:hypothetical protein
MVLDPDVSSVIYRVGERMGQKSPKQIEICQKEGEKSVSGKRGREEQTNRYIKIKERKRNAEIDEQ